MRFESDVIPDSGKTVFYTCVSVKWFESDVIPDSGKTFPALCAAESTFESDVIPDSGKTSKLLEDYCQSLRVM